MVCSHFVLDRCCNLGYIIAQPDPTRGALREASHGVGAGTVLSAGHAAGARRPLAALCWSKFKRLKEPCARSSSALPSFTQASRAARRASLNHLQLRASQPWATRCWLFDRDDDHTHAVI